MCSACRRMQKGQGIGKLCVPDRLTDRPPLQQHRPNNKRFCFYAKEHRQMSAENLHMIHIFEGRMYLTGTQRQMNHLLLIQNRVS